MRLFHISDLHIGLKLINRDLKEDQEYIFDEISRLAGEYKPDAVLIAGDIYDKSVPSAEAVETFDRLVNGLTEACHDAEIMMISGNHDSGQRVNVFRSVLARQRLHMIGLPPRTPDEHIEKVTLKDSFGEVDFYLLPFVKPSMLRRITGEDGLSYNDALHRLIEREDIDESRRNVLVSHQFYLPLGKNAEDVERMGSEIRTVGNIDEVNADLLEKFDYAALGHIHKPMKVGSEFYRYCGTPLACSVDEAGQQKGVIMVELNEKGSVSTEVLPLIPLRQVRVIRDSYENVLKEGCDDYVAVVLTDTEDLDVLDMQDRLRGEFPRLLDIRRDNSGRDPSNEDDSVGYSKNLGPFELCSGFLGGVTDIERDILADVINTVKEG